jgi:hypothetical protein
MRRLAVLGGAALLLAGCGGSSGPNVPKISAARTYSLVDFRPAAPVQPDKPVTMTFAIRLPSGSLLRHFKKGPGPHTGVHLIMVRQDLATIIHLHPPVKNGVATAHVTFPEPGPYRVVVDAYPSTGTQPNFQLFGRVRVKGPYRPQPLPPTTSTDIVDGYHFRLLGRPKLHAIEANDIIVTVTDPHGRLVHFTPWFGALAHAIFFRRGSLDYFHTHICAPGATGCTSVLGTAKVTGTSVTPGELTVGVLVPAPGTWRLFLQCRVNGHILTAPFTLTVH